MIMVGKPERFALKCLSSGSSDGEGKVYIVIGGIEYGNNENFPLSSFFNVNFDFLAKFDPFYPDLFPYSAEDILKSLDAVWEDTSIENCPIESSFPGFFDDPTELLGNIVFYGGSYAFEGTSVVLVSNTNASRLMVRDDDHGIGEVTLGRFEFREKLWEFRNLYERSKAT